jgi:hypothetical protein
MTISVLDNSLLLDIYYEESDCEFDDNICVSFVEECPDEEKILIHDETNIYLTVKQARELAEALQAAASASEQACED